MDNIKDQINFLQKMEELKLYLIEFDENGIIKAKVYLADCAIRKK